MPTYFPRACVHAACSYIGRLAKGGKVFDRGDISFKLGAREVIQGWDLGIEGMAVGSKRNLVVHPSLAYGQQGAGRDIPPNATLLFDVELVRIK